jgi:excisionase family DNA binding protein
MPPIPTKFAPQLIKPSEAAQILRVHVRTVQTWIEKGAIPYIELPTSGIQPSYRIPLQGLLSSLAGNYDLAGELEQLYAGPEASDVDLKAIIDGDAQTAAR